MSQKSPPPMALERRRTLTMTWEGLGEDDEDDRFFESLERLSTAIPTDLASSGSDEDEVFDDSRMSFASAVSSASLMSTLEEIRDHESVRGGSGGGGGNMNIFGDYNMWMTEFSGSINERRRRLFQDMGLSSNKNLLSSLNSTKLAKVVSRKAPPENNQSKQETNVVVSKGFSTDTKPLQQVPKQEALPTKEIMLVRSRSDGDIDISSINTRMRKEEIVGPVSKQHLTRTSSTLLTPQAGIYPYANTMRASPNRNGDREMMDNNGAMSSVIADGQFGAFFLIKDLDSGKEFIVKEFNDDGMWNRLSEVQTGKQLTMEEFEKSVGFSPVVKELMRRENVSRGLDDGRKISANSYFSKSFRNSKRKGAALLKNIKGVASSFSGSLAEREKEHTPMETDQKNNKNLVSQWVKVRQQGKSVKEFTALQLCQEIHAHEGSIWTIKFSPDARYLASAGEDRVVHVWEVQECDVMSSRPGDDSGFAMSADYPSLGDVSPLPSERGKERPPLAELPPMPSERKKRGKTSNKKKGNSIPDYVYMPETVFSLSEKPVCSFTGHQDDVLDLSWSKAQLLLSASMDKTVRLWDMETKSCLKLFAHNDYVTCIQFNPVDDNYFISGSLDAKVRIWSVPDRQLVDYTDLHEMVTAVRYTPDGQTALIGSHKGGFRSYSTADCCLEQKEQIELRRKKKKEAKKITGFEFAPGNSTEVLVTSADSRIRIVQGSDVTQKFRGFRNTSSQIAASFSADGKYVVSASEDSQVYIWKREEQRKSKGSVTTLAHEYFQCKDVSVATPWPGSIRHDPPMVEVHSKRHSKRFIQPQNINGGSPCRDELGISSRRMLPPLPKKTSATDDDLAHGSPKTEDGIHSKRHLPPLPKKNANSDRTQNCHDEEPTQTQLPPHPNKNGAIDDRTNYEGQDDIQASCTDSNTGEKTKNGASERGTSSNEEDPEDPSRVSRTDSDMGVGDSFTSASSSIRYDPASISASSNSPSQSWSMSDGINNHGGHTVQASAWGMVIVTAGLGGEIRTYQNIGLPVKVSRQTNLF